MTPKYLNIQHIRSCAVFLTVLAMGVVISNSAAEQGHGAELESASLTGGRYAIENIIIMIIDGLRNEEAFDDPFHQYIPHIWNDLRPQGTIYTDFYTATWPVTTPGHLSMLTGTRSNVPLSVSSFSGNSREHRPTVFEAYRKTFGLPENQTWIVSGKNQLSTCDYSLHPLWGEEYGSRREIGVGDNDIETMERFYTVLENGHPSLALLNLRDVDKQGHSGIFEDYTDAIVIADSLANDLWLKIQADPLYQDKTLLIVTTDHGRSLSNFVSHGGTTHSNRHIFFLALGPGISQGLEVSTYAFCTDIASTIAEILGFELPFSEGRILYEMLESYVSDEILPRSPETGNGANISNSSGFSILPSIDVDSDGLHVVWSERSAQDVEEHRHIMYTTSSDSGSSWSVMDTLLTDFSFYSKRFPDEIIGAWGNNNFGGEFEVKGVVSNLRGGTPIAATIKCRGNGDLTVASNGYSITSFSSTDLISWSVNLASKESEGSWFEQGIENLGAAIVSAPGVAYDGSSVWTAWTDGVHKLSMGKAKTTDIIVSRSIKLPNQNGNDRHYRKPMIAVENGQLHLVFEFITKETGRVLYLNFNTSNKELNYMAILDNNGDPSIDPRLAVSEGEVFVVWAESDGGPFQIQFCKSDDSGNSFEEIQQLTSSTTGAWYPDITTSGDTVVVVWEDYRDGTGEIYMTVSSDRGASWGPETRLTNEAALSCYPRVVGYEGKFYVVWQDYRDGNWDIYFDVIN